MVEQTQTPNPLKGFFRKPKFQMTLPTNGKWYPTGMLQANPDGSVDVYSMTAADDLKFRAGEASLSGKNTFNLIHNCIPNILDPMELPSLDLDTVLLAIRMASYGDKLQLSCDVPNTSLVRKVDVKISDILKTVPDISEWDDTLSITNENNETLTVILRPVPLKVIFDTSKNLLRTRQQMTSLAKGEGDTEPGLQQYDTSVSLIGTLTINVVCQSIVQLSLPDGSVESDPTKILAIINSLDVEYFNAIREHLENQKAKFALKTAPIVSTQAEVAAGAPESWNGDINFAGSDFFTK